MVHKYGDVLLYDIETQVFGRPDINRDILKLFGCYSYKTEKYYSLTKIEDIRKIINAHKILVGFNTEGLGPNKGYDNPILERYGIDLKYKIKVDLQNIFRQRCAQMKIKEGILSDLLMTFSLDYITKTIHIVDEGTGKLHIDKKLFVKETFSKEEWQEMVEYNRRDIEVTKKLYEWCEEYFWGFRDFISSHDVEKKVYLTATFSKIAYKAVCRELHWEEKYSEHIRGETFKGAGVSYPAGEEFKGNIVCFDFKSMYSHAMMQGNLYGRKKEGDISNRLTWTGSGVWKVQGEYYSDKLAAVGELIKRWFMLRVEYQSKKDSREYSLKIILNILYGILGDPYYMLTYDLIGASDCTALGKQWIVYARKKFKEVGYIVIYSDTDSCYLYDPFNDMIKLLKVRDEIISYIKSTVPFPQLTFDMPLDTKIRYMFFFKGKGEEKDNEPLDDDDMINKMKNLLKKNYCYVTTDGELVVKNLGIRKKSTSALTRKIFWDYLAPQIKEGVIKFKKSYLRNLIIELLEKDYKLACMRKEVDNYDDYKEKTSLPAQIAQKYGSGIHFLIPNLKNIGVGKGKQFCTVEEFEQHKLKLSDIDLGNVWLELGYFIAPIVTKNIFDYVETKGDTNGKKV